MPDIPHPCARAVGAMIAITRKKETNIQAMTQGFCFLLLWNMLFLLASGLLSVCLLACHLFQAELPRLEFFVGDHTGPDELDGSHQHDSGGSIERRAVH